MALLILNFRSVGAIVAFFFFMELNFLNLGLHVKLEFHKFKFLKSDKFLNILQRVVEH